MQRKNSFLKNTFLKKVRGYNKRARSAIAMIMAITVLVVMATIMALSLTLTTQTSKQTTDLYLYEQAVLLSQSAAEYSLLQLSNVNPCSIDNINFDYNVIYNVNVDMRYITNVGSSCEGNLTNPTDLYTNIVEPESDGTVLMDITITVDAGNEPIRYFRRSLQKL